MTPGNRLMAGADQSFGEEWWGPRDFQRNSFADIDPLLSSITQTFDLDDVLGQNPYNLHGGMHRGDIRANDHAWLPNSPNLNVQMLPLVFNTAPPHCDRPSQVHKLRGYDTAPQSHNAQPWNLAPHSSMAFNQDEDVDFESFIVSPSSCLELNSLLTEDL